MHSVCYVQISARFVHFVVNVDLNQHRCFKKETWKHWDHMKPYSQSHHIQEKNVILSSPWAKTELPQWGGEDFLSRQQIFFTETALTPERKVEKSFPRSEINRHAEG